MSDVIGMGGPDGSIEALRTLLSDQAFERLTHGNPRRSKALLLCHAYAVDFHEPEYADLALRLAHTWAGEDGWAMGALTRLLAAAKVQTQIQAREGEDA